MKATKENVWDSIPVYILKHKEQAIVKPRIAIMGKGKVENSQKGAGGRREKGWVITMSIRLK